MLSGGHREIQEDAQVKHIMAITYKPQEQGVRDGTIRQTIRLMKPSKKTGRVREVRAGDSILFHNWKKKPYRSKWGWRTEKMVMEALNIELHAKGIFIYTTDEWIDWHYVKYLAELDGINPPTGEKLHRVLVKLNGGKEFSGEEAQIIRW